MIGDETRSAVSTWFKTGRLLVQAAGGSAVTFGLAWLDGAVRRRSRRAPEGGSQPGGSLTGPVGAADAAGGSTADLWTPAVPWVDQELVARKVANLNGATILAARGFCVAQDEGPSLTWKVTSGAAEYKVRLSKLALGPTRPNKQ